MINHNYSWSCQSVSHQVRWSIIQTVIIHSVSQSPSQAVNQPVSQPVSQLRDLLQSVLLLIRPLAWLCSSRAIPMENPFSYFDQRSSGVPKPFCCSGQFQFTLNTPNHLTKLAYCLLMAPSTTVCMLMIRTNSSLLAVPSLLPLRNYM